jgi:hypothetical protein
MQHAQEDLSRALAQLRRVQPLLDDPIDDFGLCFPLSVTHAAEILDGIAAGVDCPN